MGGRVGQDGFETTACPEFSGPRIDLFACHFYVFGGKPRHEAPLFCILGSSVGALGWAQQERLQRTGVRFSSLCRFQTGASVAAVTQTQPPLAEPGAGLGGGRSQTKNMQRSDFCRANCVPQISCFEILAPRTSEQDLV